MEPEAADVPIGMEVVGNEDLLAEILVRLPPKSLLRFRSVSKTWLRLISCTQLRRRNSQRLRQEISGLFLIPRNNYYRPRSARGIRFINLDESAGARSPVERLDFVDGMLEVVDHCNGLLLCSSSTISRIGYREYHVFNPTTKDYATVSVDLILKFGEIDTKIYAASLAFDPRKSLHYKLLFIYRSGLSLISATYFLQIYSSDTCVMRKINNPFRTLILPHWGVYWNGAINWLDTRKGGLYFNVAEERFGKLPMPPVSEDEEKDERSVDYYGESNDNLHLIQCFSPSRLQLYVYEMDREYSGWLVRFRVDLQRSLKSYPLLTLDQLEDFDVMRVFRKNDEKSFLVFSTRGMVFRVNFEDESLAMITTMASEQGQYDWYNSVPFIESLYRP